MKVIIPLDEDQKVICPVFGRAPYFGIFDTEQETLEIKENPAAQAQGGAGLEAAQFVLDCHADVLITPRCGKNSAEAFQEAEVKIYKSEGSDARENLNAFQNGKLALLDHFHGGYQGIR